MTAFERCDLLVDPRFQGVRDNFASIIRQMGELLSFDSTQDILKTTEYGRNLVVSNDVFTTFGNGTSRTHLENFAKQRVQLCHSVYDLGYISTIGPYPIDVRFSTSRKTIEIRDGCHRMSILLFIAKPIIMDIY